MCCAGLILLAFERLLVHLLLPEGEVYIWDTDNEEEPVLYKSGQHVMNHMDPISRVKFVGARREAMLRYLVLTIAGDGKILVWSDKNELKKPVTGYEVKNRRGQLTGLLSICTMQSASSALRGLGEAPTLENYTLVGNEVGNVYRVTVKSINVDAIPTDTGDDDEGPGKRKKVILKNPVSFTYEAHAGPVQQMASSPFHRNLFLTASSDGQCRLFSTLETESMMAVEPPQSPYLYDAQFSPFRPFVFAVAGKDGYMYIYDLESDRVSPCAAEKVSAGHPCTSVKFNPTINNYVATGDGAGNLQVWQLSSALSNPTNAEVKITGTKNAAIQREIWMKHTGMSL